MLSILFIFSVPPVRQAFSWRYLGLALFALTLFFSASVVRADEPDPVDGFPTAWQPAKSLESELPAHRAEIEGLKTKLQQLQTQQNAVLAEISAYNSQDTAHKQLLLMSKLRIEDLENAIKDNRLASKSLTERIDTLRKQRDSTAASFEKTAASMELAKKRLADGRESHLSNPPQQPPDGTTQKLLQLLEQKKQILKRCLEIYDDLLGRLRSSLEAKLAMGEKLIAQLENLKEASLFQRMAPYSDLSGQTLLQNLRLFRDRFSAIFSYASWEDLWKQMKLGGVAPWLIFFTLLVLSIALPWRYRSNLQQIEKRYSQPRQHYRWLCLILLRRSLPYLGLTPLFGIYSSVRFSLIDVELGRFLFFAFLVLLITRWGLDFFKHGFRVRPLGLQSFVSVRLRRFLRYYRVAIILVLLLFSIAGSESLLAWMSWIVVSASFLAWTIVFWQRMKPVLIEEVRKGQAAPNPKMLGMIRAETYLIFGGTLLLTLVGYGTLAGYWFRVWTESMVLLLWGWISLNAIREWHRDYRARVTVADGDRRLTSADHWHWSLIHLARAVWVFALAAGIIWIWDSSGFILSWLASFFNLTLTIGSLNLSIKGVLLAIGIIFLTYLASRVGQALLKEKVLDRQSLDRGLKDSILTIATYLGWGVGLVLALGILGVNTTSLAVIFGALSIGIGFGLQNIFNNFISGLILLLERPIQVGDYVEVGDLWAEVKKINVRATIVQTFDNASVIIPNSEFISKQVTNWSFKDKRMRRNLDIGVAYGSDIDLVQKTLLDVIQQTSGVLKYPKPDVLFIDHGDSALIFRMRIWVDVNDYWTVPSQIRCKIDRCFRELAIEIAFPQRDLHIRSISKEIMPVVSSSGSHLT